MKVAIRVDASSTVGIGHVRRCLSLGHALRDQGAEIGFVTRDLGVGAAQLIAKAGFDDVQVLAAPGVEIFTPDPAIPHSAWAQVTQERDTADTIAALSNAPPDWLVVDSYAFDANWHRLVGKALGCNIAAIDDLADRAMECDVIIDHTYVLDHTAKYAPVSQGAAKVLGGPQFALLGPAFAKAQRYEFSPQVRSIGVFMGGVDIGNHSAAVLDAIDEAGFAGPVEVVATSANPNLAALQERMAMRPGTTLSLDLPDLAEFFARHDLQVGAGGGASWERCCIGAPTVLVILADNQNSVAPQLAADGIVALAPEPSVPAIARELARLVESAEKRRELAEKSRALVDGRGAARVAKEMLCLG